MKKHKFPTFLMLLFYSVLCLFLISSCNKSEPDTKTKTANDYIYTYFKEWYLWYDKIPNIDPDGIESQEALIDSIKAPQDRWSFSASLTKVEKLFQGGAYTGFGAGMMLDAKRKIRVTYVYFNSPFGRAGVQRGWTVNSVNGYTVDQLDSVNSILSKKETITFELSGPDNYSQTSTLTREEISMNTVLYSNTYSINQHKVGYFVFDSFLKTSEAELDTIFSRFKKDNVTDLIVDLRYNGGGLNDIAYKLIGMIAGSKVSNQVITMVKHNDKHSDKNFNEISSFKGPSVELNKVYFITTSQTASASELVINSLKPYMDVVLVGSHTHGKPVGMYVFEVKDLDLAILPICFKTTNKLGYGDYFDGLPVTIDEVDDVSHNWGDPNEGMLKTTLAAITQPAISYLPSPLKSQAAEAIQPIGYLGLNQIIGAY